MILPFLEASPLYNQFNPNVSVADPLNQTFLEAATISAWKCPSDPQPDRWSIEDEHSPGTMLATLPIANYVAGFGTQDIDDCENAPGNAPVAADGQCVGDGAFFHDSSVQFRDVTDGLSNTLIVGERMTQPTLDWYSTWVGMVPNGTEAFQRVQGAFDHVPNDPIGHFDDFSSRHEGGAQFVLGDGSARFVSENIDKTLYQSLGTIRGGEVTGEF